MCAPWWAGSVHLPDRGQEGCWKRTHRPSAAQPYDPLERWSHLSLATQFLLAGGLVSVLAMAVIGFLVKSQIESGVTRNSAAATALYVDSIIAPLLPDMQTSQTLNESTAHALDEVLGPGALGHQLMSFRLWRPDGTILYANDPRPDRQALRAQQEPQGSLCTANWWPSSTRSMDPESDKERRQRRAFAGDLQPGAPALVGRGGRRHRILRGRARPGPRP